MWKLSFQFFILIINNISFLFYINALNTDRYIGNKILISIIDKVSKLGKKKNIALPAALLCIFSNLISNMHLHLRA